MVQQTSGLIGDLAGRVQANTMSLFIYFGHDHTEELRQEVSDAAVFKGT